MPKNILFVFFLFVGVAMSAQLIPQNGQMSSNISNRFIDNENDTVPKYQGESKIKLSGKTKFTDYKVISFDHDTTFIDTTLSISTYYKFNYLRKDNFELQAFQNQGQTFNKLAYSFDDASIFPSLGATAQHYNFYEVDDVKYFYVPTPTTELMYRTGIEQGQVLDALFTFNLSEQFNASVSFKGLRSLGNYQNILSDHGNFRLTSSYHTKNRRYVIRAHIVAQDLNNEQNGGLPDESIEVFESGDANFKDRGRMTTNYTDAETILRGNRYYFDHYFKLWQEKDSVPTRKLSDLKIGHVFNYDLKNYQFKQNSENSIFGEAYVSPIDDKARYTKIYNELFASFKSPFVLGEFKVNVSDFNYSYNFNSILVANDEVVDSSLEGNLISVGADWKTDFKKFNLRAKASTIVSGELNGSLISASASYKIDSLSEIKVGGFTNSKSPNFNFLLYHSDYVSYNWQNNFKNEQIKNFYASFNSSKWFNVSAEINSIDNYSYFSSPTEDVQATPMQSEETVNYFKLKLGKEFRLGKFALDNTFIYQNVSSGSDVFRVPDFITRNSFYFSDHIFKGDPMFLQTGITFTYFSKYYMNSYNPLISEFSVQDEYELGGYPMFDFFINAQIQRVRLYFMLEHFNSHYTGYNYYSAPRYPYRDFKIRFGLVWNFFI